MNFSSKNRQHTLEELASSKLDVLVVGGGITGCGIALDATTRGLTTGLIDMQDFAAGTSSRSTKLVHGGLRYLKQFEVKMVAEVGKEREIVYENGPHVTTPEWMLLPLHKGGTFGKLSTSIGLRVYDFLAGVKRRERRRMLGVQETIQKEPLIKKEGLRGAGYYVEYRTDDARLTIEVLKEAVQHGAKAVSYAKVVELLYKDGRVIGVEVEDQITKKRYDLYAEKVVNATGPWVDNLRKQDRSNNGKNLRLTKGVHLVFDAAKFPLKQAVYFDTPDGRMVFAIPRDGKTYVGTTDTFFNDEPSHPKATKQDVEYIIKSMKFMFPEVVVSEQDVESTWAGVRPLIYEEGKDPSEISRKDEVWESESGLITIAGGKLTGYRKMAEMVVDLMVQNPVFKKNSSVKQACQTKKMPISGGHVNGSKNLSSFVKSFEKEAQGLGFTIEEYNHLADMYGSNIEELLNHAKTYSPEISGGLPLPIYVQLQYSLNSEMTYKPVDFFIRRTGALFFQIDWVQTWKKPVIDFMAKELGWNAEQKDVYTSELEKELQDAMHPEE
ncbi:glycerol-3-phosphate dehydrogenase [Bacillus mesophilus]|uniref:Glycerol-3-phosphate dehydrogenase n=1 Tax=Bacillus mesophilus TaxID=1808955 RepID=A0A6M0Q7E0_9BACI|nr:glycerol-3-phosphate dehydrogenase/oxidase [Bacillus mesophilus]MBM7661558.1 glycerol-3-phosphate dehydrogenase [Bacillus mesophilus]NEY72227.1 glycerol-3-phosphate dehydrogenase/oxidase [Bacillus mesophilus]